MNRAVCCLWLGLMAGSSAVCAEAGSVTFEVQVVHGSDAEMPKEASWKMVRPKLAKQLSQVFRWKHYWEVSRQPVTLAVGAVQKIRLTEERVLRLELLSNADAELRLYRNGKLARKARHAGSQRTSIMGGGDGPEDAWFVVVSRDKSR